MSNKKTILLVAFGLLALFAVSPISFVAAQPPPPPPPPSGPQHEHTFIVMVLVVAAVLVATYSVRSGRKVSFRRFPAIDALEEGVDRSLEQGQKVHVGMPTMKGGTPLISFKILEYIAALTAEKRVPTIFTAQIAQDLAMMKELVRDKYTAVGAPGLLGDPDMVDVRMYTGQAFGYHIAVNNLLQRENCGASFYLNDIPYSVILGEGAHDADAFSVFFTPGWHTLTFAVCCFDYALYCAEFQAVGAWISQNEYELGSILAMDITQWVSIIGTILLAAAATILGGIPGAWWLI